MKRTYRTIRTAFRALRRNPMRATLTTLGIIIGVGAVIAMMEIGTGSSASIQKSIASMGANNLSIRPGTASSGGINFGAGSIMTLTPEDAEAIVWECPAVRCAAPIVRTRTQVVYEGRNWVPIFIYGSTPAFFDAREWTDLAEGEIFKDQDVRNTGKVCVLGQTLVRELFEGQSPIGKEIRVNNVGMRVVGVLSSKGSNMMGMDQDDILIAPWTTIKYRVTGSSVSNVNQSSSSASSTSRGQLYPSTGVSLYPPQSATQQANAPMPIRFTNVDEILASGRSAREMDLAVRQITQLLRQRHRIRPGEPDDFSIRNMAELSQMLSSTTTVMTRLLLCVALISLVVGGVGIMNIMLVSVTERTREIGLRMAVGAQARNILLQFLVEAVVLCLAGGAIGILLGHGGSLLVRFFLNWSVKTSPAAIIAAVAVSATVGIVFGYYPAWKASRLDPIEALRYE
ncbi:MAG: FtsX-like permease family protein [Planctomycetes bacterium]|nr:FtsX-like permease family protein [Planctomycetota bacterium]